METLREATGADRLMLYFHLEHGTWVLCVDTSFEGEVPCVLEVHAFDEHPSTGPMPFHAIAAMCAPASGTIVEEMVTEQRKQQAEQMQADHEYRQWKIKNAEARNDPVTAEMYRRGDMPVMADIDGSGAELAYELKHQMRPSSTTRILSP